MCQDFTLLSREVVVADNLSTLRHHKLPGPQAQFTIGGIYKPEHFEPNFINEDIRRWSPTRLLHSPEVVGSSLSTHTEM